MGEILLNPLYLLLFLLFIGFFGLYIKSKRRQRDIQKGIEKALKKQNKENDEYWG